MQKVNNHPVHILNKNGDLSPSSFIPFCSFGEDLIGAEIKGFDVPVCNIFKPKNHNDQLCYETDLQELKDNNNKNLMKQLEIGLTLILDYNEERQIDFKQRSAKRSSGKAFDSNHENSVSLHLNTKSTGIRYSVLYLGIFNYLDPVSLFGEAQYNLNNLKEIYVTDSFLGLERNTRNCQSIETFDDCTTRLYLEKLRTQCGCLPLSVSLSDMVKLYKLY